MRTFKVDDNNRMVIENGDFVIVEGIEAIAICCKQVIQAQYGEMVYSIQEGIPYNILAWVGTPNLGQLEYYMRTAILAVDGVTGIESFEISVSGDTLKYSASINTIEGVLTLNDLRISK